MSGRAGSGPDVMRAAVVHAPGRLALEEIPVPQPGPGELLVRIRACGICSSDLMDWYVARKAPFVLGHEPAGEVQAVGPGVEGFRPGDRVFVHHHAPCMECPACRRGDFVHCPVWRRNSLRPGGMAELAVVAEPSVRHGTLKLPDSVSFEVATLVEPAACAVKALRRAGFAPGMRVLVVGLGFTGQIFGFLARAGGAASVEGADRIRYRLELAGQHWADAVYDVATASPPAAAFDLVVVTPASPEAMRAGIGYVRNGGTLLLFAPLAPGVEVPWPVHDMFFREVTVVTSYSAGPPDTREALAHVAAGRLPPEALISHRYPLDEAAAAYRDAARKDRVLKAVVVIDE
ncbi:MAG: alcohol dehydrogenase catalytic domain-containing protein [Firmicutes bacterium]|nr:alcohol dehydrogenase catalytic domain-containing protein [Bacillota bacterium]